MQQEEENEKLFQQVCVYWCVVDGGVGVGVDEWRCISECGMGGEVCRSVCGCRWGGG